VIILAEECDCKESVNALILKKLDDIQNTVKREYRSESYNVNEIRLSKLDEKIDVMNQNLFQKLDIIANDVTALKIDMGAIKNYHADISKRANDSCAKFRWRCGIFVGLAAVFLGAIRLFI